MDGRKCHEVLHGNLYPCDFCPTFKVMHNGIPEIREWKSGDTPFKSIVTSPDSGNIVYETLKEIEK